jgi:two-component system, chemotaxis family, protein-glutamate methylesterase/glutaminase
VPGTATARRIVVADDSRLMRRVLADALARQGFEVVGLAGDGDEALDLCRRERPDALTLDLHMPGLDGLGVLRALRDGKAEPVPVVVVSAFSPAHGARAVDALAEGAFDLVAKPGFGDSLEGFSSELARKVTEAARSGRGRRAPRRSPVAAPDGSVPSARTTPAPPATPATPPATPATLRPRPATAVRRTATGPIVVIASSTGGPRALGELLPALPAPLGAGGLLVQHMPPGFTASLAARLDGASALAVREARTGDVLDPAALLVAPGGSHLRLADDRRLRLSDDAPEGGLRPRADFTIHDAARAFGRRVLLVVLTGMGKDGLDGAAAVKRAGGCILAEAKSTCTVYGMPRAVVEAGLADRVLPLDALAGAIAEELR